MHLFTILPTYVSGRRCGIASSSTSELRKVEGEAVPGQDAKEQRWNIASLKRWQDCHTTHRKGGPGEGDQLNKGDVEFVKALAHPSRSKKGEDVGEMRYQRSCPGAKFRHSVESGHLLDVAL